MNLDPPTMTMTIATAPTAGAIGLLQLHGPSVAGILTTLTGQADWPLSRLRLVDMAGIDSGLAVLLRPDWAQLMPHGGPRVVQKLIAHLTNLGVGVEAEPAPRRVYPEAASDLEADMLGCLARAASPAVVDRLLAQPRLWSGALKDGRPLDAAAILARTERLNHLIEPPTVVVIGRPNVGKSTLTNRLMGRSASLVADLPGTTRDWVAGLAELHDGRIQDPCRGVAVHWVDTPGLRDSTDPIEQHAIGLAHQVIEQAHVLIAMRAPAPPDIPWPDMNTLQRRPDLWVLNKTDQQTAGPDSQRHPDNETTLRISALTGRGVDLLQQKILDRLGLADLDDGELWAFSPTLQAAAASGEWDTLADYAGIQSHPAFTSTPTHETTR